MKRALLLGMWMAVATPAVAGEPDLVTGDVVLAQGADAKRVHDALAALKRLATTCAAKEPVELTYCVGEGGLSVRFYGMSKPARMCMEEAIPMAPDGLDPKPSCAWVAIAASQASLAAPPSRKHDLEQWCDAPSLAGVVAEKDVAKRATAIAQWLGQHLRHPDIMVLEAQMAQADGAHKKTLFESALRADGLDPAKCVFLRP